jgi:hypothetical protein
MTTNPIGNNADMFKKLKSILLVGVILATVTVENAFGGGLGPFEIPQVSEPGYLKSYVDPMFKTRVTRITGVSGSDIPNINGKWAAIARHHYSKDAAWNCDQSILFLERHQGNPSALFLDGTTYQPLYGRKEPGTETRWHPKKPGIMVYVKDNLIGYWDVRQDTTQTAVSFPGYTDFHIGPWEGNLSHDGRRIVIEGRKGKDHIAFAYDFEEGRKYPDLILNDVADVDWVSISASGNYIVLNGQIQGQTSDQTQVYDLAGNKVGSLWEQHGRPSHYDLTIDEGGDDIAVGSSRSGADDGRVIKRRLSDGKVTVLTPGGYASHTSTRNVNRPGWAYVTYQHRGPTWPPYWDEVDAVKLDGSMMVERIAKLYTKRTDYLTESHAVPSPDGNRVLWASDWEAASGRPIFTLVAQRITAEKKTE